MKSKILLYTAIVSTVCLAVITGCKKDKGVPYENQGYLVFAGDASASQMVPAGTSAATASFSGVYDMNSQIFNYKVYWSKLSSTATGGNFYGPASAGQVAPVTRNIFTTTATTLRPATDSLKSAIFGYTKLLDNELNDLKTGKWYFIINSSTNTTGEVRGQITYQRTF